MNEAKDASKLGVSYDAPKVNLDKVRSWKKGVVRRLSLGVKSLFTDRGIELVRGHATFESDTRLRITGEEVRTVSFKHCIIASGSVAAMLPEAILPRELCWDAADALELHEIPKRLLVIGGGYIGIELSQVYASFGSEVTVVEALPEIMTGADPELVKPLRSRLRKQFKAHVCELVAVGSSCGATVHDRFLGQCLGGGLQFALGAAPAEQFKYVRGSEQPGLS